MTDSTFTDNSTDEDGGGGIYNLCGFLTVTNSTFTGNRADGLPGELFGSAIMNNNSTDRDNICGVSVLLRNTIVANSASGDNCWGDITDGGHNLDDGTSCGFSTTNGSLSNTNPQLDPAGLQDNGGPTQTVALSSGSPATDAGDDAVCAEAPVNHRDQRGFVRPGAGHMHCSIGAYEAAAVAAPQTCVGDCSGTSTVAVNDLITLVNIALGNAQPSACANGVPSGSDVTVAVIVQAVNNALSGCGAGQ